MFFMFIVTFRLKPGLQRIGSGYVGLGNSFATTKPFALQGPEKTFHDPCCMIMKQLIHLIIFGILTSLVCTSCQNSEKPASLEDRLMRDGVWAADADIQEALKQAEEGQVTAIDKWVSAHPEIAYAAEEKILLIAREIDFNRLSAQLKQPNTEKTQTSISYYHAGEVFYTLIDVRYQISEITFNEPNFSLLWNYRTPLSKETQPKDDLSFPAMAAKNLIQKGLLSSLFDGTARKPKG
jgi:hypothetical protein